MNPTAKIIKFLQNYNAWRRGDETIEMPHPAEIGESIQNAIILLRKNADLEAELATAKAQAARLRPHLLSSVEREDYHDALNKLTQLRAEVELDEALQLATERSLKNANARAKRAEVEKANALASWANTCIHHNDAERARCGRVCAVCIATERDQLRATLAAERTRLDSGQIMLIVAGERIWHCGVDLRAAIDAGMQEGVK